MSDPHRPRASELGIRIGTFPAGAENAITDVGDVRVGHSTLIEGDAIRTGVTAILPHGGDLFRDRVRAALVVGLGPAGFENSLLKKIENAQKSFDKADGEVCEKLASFIAEVDAQDGKKLTTEQADLLRSQAEALSDAYGCGT